MKSIYRSVCVGIFLIGLMAFSQSRMADSQNDIEPALPYVVKYVIYQKALNGTVTLTGRRTRYVKANGEWRLVGHNPNEETPPNDSTVMSSGSEGVFKKPRGENDLSYISPSADENLWQLYRSHSFLRNNRLFVRTEEIAGIRAYILRTEVADTANPLAWAEMAYSPKTGFIQLRTVNHFRDNSEVTIEAVSIEFKEVPENLNDDLKGMPVRNRHNN
jgi:hypothetical protein